MGASDPFDFVGDNSDGDADVGVGCLHGFTASGLLLPGPGKSVAAVEREVDAMFRRHRRVAVVGRSLVGRLALSRQPGDLPCVM